jgi:peptide/nickel transport system permease protein
MRDARELNHDELPGNASPGVPAQGATRSGGALATNRQRSRFLRQFRRSKTALVGLFVIVIFVLMALLAPLIAPYNPTKIALADSLQSSSFKHLLGTDELGRDMLSRLLWGSRLTLLITVGAVLIALVVGTALGVVAGFRGGWTDNLIMRGIDMLLAMPTFLLAIAIVAALGPGTLNVIIAVGVASVSAFARIAHGAALSVKEEDYVLSARAVGARDGHIMLHHMLPNVFPPLLVQTTLRLATAILTASGLSFLGLGPQPPTPEWGAMLSAGRTYLTSNPQLTIIPGLAILLIAIAFNLFGDGLRDALDPRMIS